MVRQAPRNLSGRFLEPKPQALPDPDGQGVEGEHGAESDGQGKIVTAPVAQQEREQGEKGQGGENHPEDFRREGGDALGIPRVDVEPGQGQDGDQRHRSEKGPEQRSAPGHLGGQNHQEGGQQQFDKVVGQGDALQSESVH